MNDTQHPLWFKRRRYGYGWTPVTWQGWLLVCLLLLTAVGGAIILLTVQYSNVLLWAYLNAVIVMVVLVLILAYRYGPSPKWRWGKKPTDDSKLDY